MQVKFIALIFALLALGSIGYCLGETADNYRWARSNYLDSSRSSNSSDYMYYDYKETMQTEVLIAGVGGLLGLVLGLRARKQGGGGIATAAIVGSLAAMGGAVFAVSEYNGLF